MAAHPMQADLELLQQQLVRTTPNTLPRTDDTTTVLVHGAIIPQHLRHASDWREKYVSPECVTDVHLFPASPVRIVRR